MEPVIIRLDQEDDIEENRSIHIHDNVFEINLDPTEPVLVWPFNTNIHVRQCTISNGDARRLNSNVFLNDNLIEFAIDNVRFRYTT